MRRNFKSTLHACYLGYITQACIANLAPLLFVLFRQQFGLSLEMLGRLVLLNFATQMIVDFLSVQFVDRIGYRVSIVGAHICAVLGLVGLSVLPQVMDPFSGLTIATILYAIGGGLIEVLVSPIVDSLPGDAKASSMSLLHAFYCWGQVAVVLLSTLFLHFWSGSWPLLPLLWALLPLGNLFFFLRVPLMPVVEEERRIPLGKLLRSKTFLLFMLLMTCAGASELGMCQWASYFAEAGLGVGKVLGDLLGPCLFAVFMGIGRTVYGILGDRLPLRPALLTCGGLTIACYLVAALSPIPFLNLLGCSLCGLGVSLMWPGTLSLAADRYREGGTATFGILAMSGDIGCSVGPWLIGLISSAAAEAPAFSSQVSALGADSFGLRAGLMIATIFPVLLLVGILFLRTPKKS